MGTLKNKFYESSKFGKWLDENSYGPFKSNGIVTPTPKQVLQNTVVVTMFTLIVGSFVWLVDTAVYGVISIVMSMAG